MVVTDPDVLTVADLLSRRYGSEAKRHALQRISELAEEGDLVGRDLWEQVADAIEEIDAAGSPRGSLLRC